MLGLAGSFTIRSRFTDDFEAASRQKQISHTQYFRVYMQNWSKVLSICFKNVHVTKRLGMQQNPHWLQWAASYVT